MRDDALTLRGRILCNDYVGVNSAHVLYGFGDCGARGGVGHSVTEVRGGRRSAEQGGRWGCRGGRERQAESRP